MSRPDSRRCTFTEVNIAPSVFQLGEAQCNDIGGKLASSLLLLLVFFFLFFFKLSQRVG